MLRSINPLSNFYLTDATLDHLKRLLIMENECFDATYAFDKELWKEFFSGTSFFNKIVLASDKPDNKNNPILANMVATISVEHENAVYIETVAVNKAYRKKGIARALFQELVNAIENHNSQYPDDAYESIYLEVDRENADACGLYLKLGFVEMPELNSLRQCYMGVKLTEIKTRLQSNSSAKNKVASQKGSGADAMLRAIWSDKSKALTIKPSLQLGQG